MDVTTRASTRPPGEVADAAGQLAGLRNAAAVRERCRKVLAWVRDGKSPHFVLDESKLDAVAADVAAVTRADYPDLVIPPHSRWRHFSVGGIDRWSKLSVSLNDKRTRARAAIDLATVSVLLDAGAGDQWHYREPASGREFSRSEGLAVASLDMFAAGVFSSNPTQPLQADATALKRIDPAKLGKWFQIGADNPLIGLDGRADLLRRLGAALATRPDLYGADGRPSRLVDYFGAKGTRVSTTALLAVQLESLASIWPSALVVKGVAIGDAGFHPAAHTDDATDRIVPFHKLSQWLTYSLIEPLADAGFAIADLDGLTALPEYRNGGLLIDRGVIVPRRPATVPQAITSELVVEWRALTVALFDELLPRVRARLGLGPEFGLPQMLQGGTWSAGRKIARELRPPAGPSPIPLAADGTIF